MGVHGLANYADKRLDEFEMSHLVTLLQHRIVWHRFIRAGESTTRAAEFASAALTAQDGENYLRSEAKRRAK